MALPAGAARAAGTKDWLEVIAADSPLLLIAPHGGRAEPRTRAILHPKVNDLHTAAITRELAARVGASALINHAMDRNRLDCNRIAQIAESAPWLLEMIDERLREIVERHGRATILLIHGWNIIEPRVDFGLGLKLLGGELRPPGAAHVSASDEFIRGPLAAFASRLREGGIKPSFGMRYPAGGAQNLLQAFTRRHRESTVAALRAMAETADSGTLDALQLEFSVACRMPGPLRERCIDAMASAFAPSSKIKNTESGGTPIIRMPRPKLVSPVAKAPPPQPTRVGIELYDPASRIGAMASFDLGAGGFGARIMILLGARRVALFTGEGRVERTERGIALGALKLDQHGESLKLSFDGAAVIVPDSTEYLSIERALASGRLDPALRINVELTPFGTPLDLAEILVAAKDPARLATALASFGKIDGEIVVEGDARALGGHARAGVSFTGLGPAKFASRRMAWVCFDASTALEMRHTTSDAGDELRSARVMTDGEWREHELCSLTLEAPEVESPPHQMEAEIAAADATKRRIVGNPESFIPLSRPGPDGSRIYTALGFATFTMDERSGSGMFEYSRRASSVMTADSSEEGDDPD
ncbi:MAG TPA: hypothetical protein VMA09_00375 [Candidatus Binataceae bacterium]|nr:hypothetical protein [Candidatus Binataceae bacterium]